MSNALFPNTHLISKDMCIETEWNTKVWPSVSGREFTLSKRLYPVWKFTLPFGVLRARSFKQEYETLVGFINARRGRLDDFLFKNPRDSLVSNQGFGVGDGTTKTFEITRTLGGFSEPVGGVDAAGLEVKVGGVVSTAFTLDGTLSSIKFVTAPESGASLTWSGEYYYRCRFDKDETKLNQFSRDLYSTVLEFKTFRP